MPSAPSHDIPTLRTAFQQFKRLIGLIRPYWSWLLKGMLLGPVVGLIGMVTPYLTKLLIDEVYPTQDMTLMHVLVGGVLAVSVSSAVMRAIQGYYNLYVNTRLSNVMRLLFFNHLQHLPMRFYNNHRVGEITSRFQDVGRALNSVTKVFQMIFGQGVYLLLVPPFLFLLQWKLALIALVSIPVTVIITTLAGRSLRKHWKHTSEAYADLNALQVEALSQIRTLKTLALESYIFQKARDQMGHAVQARLKAGGLGQMVGAANSTLYGLNTALFTWLGWTFILSQQMSLGAYIAFTAYIGYMYRPIMDLVNLFSDFQQSAVHLGRMFEYLDHPAEQDPTAAYDPPTPIRQRLQGHIKLQGVSFSYTPERPVLEEINLDVTAGTSTAIVGASGSGKTTLLRLLTRMEQPEAGQIYFDGIPLTELTLPDLRRQIGVVWQEFSLLKGTILENLTMGLENVHLDAVREATRLCHIDELINDLPLGYETPVAEWGASLSGGQQQRLAIARAVLRNPPILLLDEATSNIDPQTEQALLTDLLTHLKDKTLIFITHRVATASYADQICVLEKGRVVGLGTHAELINTCALYRQMLGLSTLEHGKDQPLRAVGNR